MQFKAEQWCAVFTMEYISGEPKSDGYENSEVLFLSVDDVLVRDDLTNMSREIIKAYKDNKNGLKKSNYIAKSCTEIDYAIFGVWFYRIKMYLFYNPGCIYIRDFVLPLPIVLFICLKTKSNYGIFIIQSERTGMLWRKKKAKKLRRD